MTLISRIENKTASLPRDMYILYAIYSSISSNSKDEV